MSIRTNVYYWKCDSPLPLEQKRRYNEKYALADISDVIRSIAIDFFGEAPEAIRDTGSAGNHYAYILEHGGKSYFFRADDGILQDDYMLAEVAAMQAAARQGIPVPDVLACDVTCERHPVRYQIVEHVLYPDMNKHDQAGTLNRKKAGYEVGRIMARLHGIALDGFGFINTDHLRTTGSIQGLDISNRDYFYKCLDRHLGYLRDVSFLSAAETTEIENLFARHEQLLIVPEGSMIHKDMAFWNLLGTESEVKAVIDWDDVVSGDPVDDLAILRCFHGDDVWLPLLDGYRDLRQLPDDFEARLGLYLTRNMLWKAMIRHYMGYFEMTGNFFILNSDQNGNLEAFTRQRLAMGVSMLRSV